MNEVSKTEIEKMIQNEKTFVVQFSANWCGPCRVLTPILENVCDGNKIEAYKFNIETDPDYAKELKISSIPVVKFFQEGKEVATKIGLASRDFYEEQTSLLKG
jgi:thioredoxin 1